MYTNVFFTTLRSLDCSILYENQILSFQKNKGRFILNVKSLNNLGQKSTLNDFLNDATHIGCDFSNGDLTYFELYQNIKIFPTNFSSILLRKTNYLAHNYLENHI